MSSALGVLALCAGALFAAVALVLITLDILNKFVFAPLEAKRVAAWYAAHPGATHRDYLRSEHDRLMKSSAEYRSLMERK